jgi:hypothetical protein
MPRSRRACALLARGCAHADGAHAGCRRTRGCARCTSCTSRRARTSCRAGTRSMRACCAASASCSRRGAAAACVSRRRVRYRGGAGLSARRYFRRARDRQDGDRARGRARAQADGRGQRAPHPRVASPFAHAHQETDPFTYVEINGLRIPEPAAAYGLLWEGVSGHDVSADGHLKISSKEALKALSQYFSTGRRGLYGPSGGHAWCVRGVWGVWGDDEAGRRVQLLQLADARRQPPRRHRRREHDGPA